MNATIGRLRVRALALAGALLSCGPTTPDAATAPLSSSNGVASSSHSQTTSSSEPVASTSTTNEPCGALDKACCSDNTCQAELQCSDHKCSQSPQITQPVQEAFCTSVKLILPEQRPYKLALKSFEGGGAAKVQLAISNGSGGGTIDTLPISGEKTISGPANVLICGTNKDNDAGDCDFSCTGKHPDFRFAYPAKHGFRAKHVDIQVTPLSPH